jgi:hypothetical protein
MPRRGLEPHPTTYFLRVQVETRDVTVTRGRVTYTVETEILTEVGEVTGAVVGVGDVLIVVGNIVELDTTTEVFELAFPVDDVPPAPQTGLFPGNFSNGPFNPTSSSYVGLISGSLGVAWTSFPSGVPNALHGQ